MPDVTRFVRSSHSLMASHLAQEGCAGCSVGWLEDSHGLKTGRYSCCDESKGKPLFIPCTHKFCQLPPTAHCPSSTWEAVTISGLLFVARRFSPLCTPLCFLGQVDLLPAPILLTVRSAFNHLYLEAPEEKSPVSLPWL